MAPDDFRDKRGSDPRSRGSETRAESTNHKQNDKLGEKPAGKQGEADRSLDLLESADLLEIGPEDGSEDLLDFESGTKLQAVIKVVGVGGGGGNALNTMIASGLAGVEFVAANTDAQALAHSLAPVRVQMGDQGLGCGANPEKGRDAALHGRDRLRELLIGADMVFVTAGLGGGTGTGAAPIVAEVAREVGALTVAVVTKPFLFEGRVRQRHAERGLDELHRVVDTLITIPNQRLLAVASKSTKIKDAFRLADDVLLGAVRGISDLITGHGLINLDFNDVRTIMNEMGMALMGSGLAKGEARAVEAARAAISNPLLEDLSMEGARGVLINFTGGSDLTLHEVEEAAKLIQDASHEDANIIFGAVVDDDMEGEVRVTVIATGLDDGRIGRGRDKHDRSADFGNVMPLRREGSEMAREPVPVAEAAEEPERAEPAARREPVQGQLGEFDSPFEDEYDEPAFLRRNKRRGDEGDRELPAFLRRSAD